MSKAIKHFITITKHRHKVIAHCKKAGLLWQGLRHDLSKYSPAEFAVGASHYLGNRSPNEAEREEYGYSKAWLHHKGRNRHHFEYWTDYNPKTHRAEPVKMPYNFLAEMFCDRVAASKIYNKENYTDAHPLAYFERSKSTRFIHPETSRELEELLTMLKEKGEDEAFAYLKGKVKAFRKSERTKRKVK